MTMTGVMVMRRSTTDVILTLTIILIIRRAVSMKVTGGETVYTSDKEEAVINCYTDQPPEFCSFIRSLSLCWYR